MIKEEIIEYHPNGYIKHKIKYYDNGSKMYDQFYDENGIYHRENNLPDYQLWDENGRLKRKTYLVHEEYHNIYNPVDICFEENGKIKWKEYCLNHKQITKLKWQNKIKNI